jgi:hypothetical protein
MKNQELMLTALFIVFGVVLVTGLVIVPILEEADAKCLFLKNNGDLCKIMKSKDKG